MNETVNEPGLHTADFVAGGGAQMVREEPPAPLFAEQETDQLRTRWNDIQAGFVDEPRMAVSQADELVTSAMKRLAEVFADERDKLEQEWDRGGDVSTENLRQVLQRYRSFFNRLLAM
jgi:hypothetical protein